MLCNKFDHEDKDTRSYHSPVAVPNPKAQASGSSSRLPRSIVDQHRDHIDSSISWVHVQPPTAISGRPSPLNRPMAKEPAGGINTNSHGRLERSIAIAHQHPGFCQPVLSLISGRGFPSLLKSPTAIEPKRRCRPVGPEIRWHAERPVPLPSRTEKPGAGTGESMATARSWI